MADAKREDRPSCDALQEELEANVRLYRRLRRVQKQAKKLCMTDIEALVRLSMPPGKGGSGGSESNQR